jgi:acyl-CoA synthetase (AMP-forming)/AMP-acid ligase II
MSMPDTVPAALAHAAREFGDAEALAQPDGPRLSFADLHERAHTMARALIADGVRAGDRVAIWAPNTYHWVVAALGTLSAGATLVPVNTRYTGPEALDVVGRSGARVLFVAEPFLGVDRREALRAAAGMAGAALPGTIITVPLAAEFPDRPLCSVEEADARAAAVSPDDISDILFTSGTTGRSKGAMSAHRQALAVARAWVDCGRVTRDDRYLVVNPFFHSFGYKAGILAGLVSGATIVPQAVFDAGRALELVERERVTLLPGPPTLYQTMLDHPDRSRHDVSTLRLAVTGAATVPPAFVERIRAELGFETVLTAYGLTEAVVVTMCRPGDDPETVAHTSGRATADFDVRIADTGEILLRGPNVMLGYLDDPAATALAVDEDGWLHTGDVGRLDDRGYLTITDRLKDMYICGGFNVYPAEVEHVIAGLAGVAESVVIGVKDERLGEVGRAYVIPRPGHALSTDDVLAHCRERLAGFKVPRQVEFRADFPRTAAGKPLKRVLREETTA